MRSSPPVLLRAHTVLAATLSILSSGCGGDAADVTLEVPAPLTLCSAQYVISDAASFVFADARRGQARLTLEAGAYRVDLDRTLEELPGASDVGAPIDFAGASTLELPDGVVGALEPLRDGEAFRVGGQLPAGGELLAVEQAVTFPDGRTGSLFLRSELLAGDVAELVEPYDPQVFSAWLAGDDPPSYDLTSCDFLGFEGYADFPRTTLRVEHDRGFVELDVVAGYSPQPPPQPQPLVAARGELDGVAFAQAGYFQLLNATPGPVAHYGVLFDQPIGEACGVGFQAVSPEENIDFPRTGTTLDCALAEQEDLQVLSVDVLAPE